MVTKLLLASLTALAKDGKLTLVGADGYRLAIESLDRGKSVRRWYE